MDGNISPVLLYGGCAVGALGVALALPRRGLSPQVLGGLIAAIGAGLIALAVGLSAGWLGIPNVLFYIFAAIALGASLRVISHPRPVYAALYFILTILATAGLFLLLSAEFMAFALIIVYAGAILITYLFVIMLATETPSAEQVEALAEYDRFSREPVVSTIIGFVLLGALLTLFARGTTVMQSPGVYAEGARLAELPRRIERTLRAEQVIGADEMIRVDEQGRPMVDLVARTAVVGPGRGGGGEPGREKLVRLPEELHLTNTEGVAFELLANHPGSIEIAGVVLLMAMLGAVVLARKKVELDEAAKVAAARGSTGVAPGGGI